MKKAMLALTLGLILSGSAVAQPGERQGDRPAPPPPPREGGRSESAFHDGPRRGPGRFDGPLTREELKQAADIIREFKPDTAARIDEAIEKDPEAVGRLIGHWMPRVRELMWLKREDQPLYELRVKDFRYERETEVLAQRYREAVAKNDGTADAIKQELIAKVNEHFPIRQQIRERRLERMEKRLQEQREMLKEMQEKKDQLVNERVKELTQSDEKYEW